MVGVEMTPMIALNFHSPTRAITVAAVSGGGLVKFIRLLRPSYFTQVA